MLILNAGVMALGKRELSKQGIEMQMATNVVGHFKLTAVMFDLCKAGSRSRIVVLSSGLHREAKTINFADFNRDKSYNKWETYSETKLSNLLFVRKLNRLCVEKGVSNVTVVGCHPGVTSTNLASHLPWLLGFILHTFLAQSVEQGVLPTILAATDPKVQRDWYAGPNGPKERSGSAAKWDCFQNKLVTDIKLQDDLWTKCEDLTSCNFSGKI